MKLAKQVFRPALICFIAFSVLIGIIYTLVITGIAQVIFPYQANGSIIEIDGVKYGSALLGQQYTDDAHMWGRITNLDVSTYTNKDGEQLVYAAPSNKTPMSDEYKEMIDERVAKIQAANPDMAGTPIPVDLVTNSGSGLDPNISVAAAEYQIPRLVKATGKSAEEIQSIIDKYTTGRWLTIFGEPVVNVLKVNLALDGVLQ